jgi:alpha-galactosidase
MQILDMQNGLREYAGPDHWNDPDMMQVGNGMPDNENRAHFSMWCMLAAPLIAGNDIQNMTKETAEVLTNPEAISVNQDPLGIQGLRYLQKDSLEVWFKPLQNDEWAVCFLNRSTGSKDVAFNWKENVVNDEFAKRILDADKTGYKLRDVWAKKDIGDTGKSFKVNIPSRDVRMLRMVPVK